jgi:hypothetical protein
VFETIYKCRVCLQKFGWQKYETEAEAIASIKVPNGMYAVHFCEKVEGTPKWIGNADFIGICEVEEDGQEEV